MYTIKWVSDQLGLTPGTLRAWEQRYGIVHPLRSAGGYRLYDDADLTTLRAMAHLVKQGMQPAQAAEQMRPDRLPPRGDPAATTEDVSGLPDARSLIAASLTYDLHALDKTLDTAFAAAQFEHVVDRWLMPALSLVGEAWAAGDIDVGQEHFISAGVMRRLAAAFDAAGLARGGPCVITGVAPGATHEIATLAFATMLRRAGIRVTYLGADLPVESWLGAVLVVRPDAAVIGAPLATDRSSATRVVKALHAAVPDTPLYVGGRGADAKHALQGTSLAEASDWLAGVLISS